MKRKLIVHIGLPKTGSSSIQHYLTQNRKPLARNGVFYEPSPGGNNHSMVSTATVFKNNPRKWAEEVGRKGMAVTSQIDEFWASFDRTMTGLDPDIGTVILSAERFSTHLNTPEKITQFRNVMAPYFDDFSIVAYIRRQDAHSTSSYSQILRFGIIQDPSLVQKGSRYAQLYDYAALLGNWSGVFGEAAVVPRIFERTSMRDGDVLADFLEVCGLSDAPLPKPRAPVRNQSMDLQGQTLLLAIGRLLQEQNGTEKVGGKMWDELTGVVSHCCPGQGWRPSQAEAKAFMEQYEASNESVRQRWFPERATLFDPDYSKLPEDAVTLDQKPSLELASRIILESLRRGLHVDSKARLTRAELSLERGETEKAAVQLQKAVNLNGSNLKARLALARHMAATGDTAAAKGQAEAIMAARPTHKAARKFLKQLNAEA